MREMEKEMSSGVRYYERDLLNVARQGRGVPAAALLRYRPGKEPRKPHRKPAPAKAEA